MHNDRRERDIATTKLAKESQNAAFIVHQLPSAPKFAGRENELSQIRDFWTATHGVLSLIGSGGAGKTALLSEFLRRTIESNDFDRILVWSFYDDPNTNAFLRTAYLHFGSENELDAKGAGWFHLLKEALSDGGRYLIVMDGLERVQRTQTDSKGIFGELEDPLLQGLLHRMVTGAGRTHVIITSRFPITDIENKVGDGHRVLDVDHMDEPAAIQLLLNRGVSGSEDGAKALIRGFGNHALTLDLLGGAIKHFMNGDPGALKPPGLEGLDEDAFQPMRLATVLQTYQTHLPERIVDLLSRLCVFRFGVDLDALVEIFLKNSDGKVAGKLRGVERSQLEADLDHLVELHLVYRDQRNDYTIHPAVRDHFYRLFRDPQSIHNAVSSHLMTLSARPGIGLPTEADSLDVLEELVYHAIQAGHIEQAEAIYADRLGGGEHLNTRLGEYTRCSRILSAFPDCPDPSAAYHSERAFGHFGEALKWRPRNVYILLLCGRLPEVMSTGSDTAKRAAAFLMGISPIPPDRCPDYPIPASRFHLYRRRADEAKRVALRDIEHSLYTDDIVRNQFALAEAELLLSNVTRAKALFDEAALWTMSSGSHEHLLWMHLLRAKLVSATNPQGALSALTEAMQLAQDSHFDLAVIDVANEQARIHARQNDWEQAIQQARLALALSESANTKYAWGRESALRLLMSQSEARQEPSAAQHLKTLRDLQASLDHPDLSQTERWLANLA